MIVYTTQILICKLEGKIPFARPMCEWDDNFIMDVGEIGWEYLNWMHISQDRDHWRALVKTVMNLRIL
jgi:hypothetical protein